MIIPRLPHRPYQEKVLNETKDLQEFAILWEQGLGKSKTIIDTSAHLFDNGSINGLIIISHKTVVANWRFEEIPKHMPHEIPYADYQWSNNKTRKESDKRKIWLANTKDKLAILYINKDALRTTRGFELAEAFCNTLRCLMVIDESTIIKNTSAKQTKQITKLGKLCKYRRILSGTPNPNGNLDLFGQYTFLNPNILGHKSIYSFKGEFCIEETQYAGQRSYRKVIGMKNEDILEKRIGPITSRLRKKDVAKDLPDKIYTRHFFELSDSQKKAYNILQTECALDLSNYVDSRETLNIENALSKLIRMRQITSGFLPTETGETHNFKSNSKLKALLEVVSGTDDKIIIWAEFRHDVNAIYEALTEEYGEGSTVRLYGAIKQEDRQIALDMFKYTDNTRFLVANYQTGAWGLTLTESATTIMYSHTYNFEHRDQAEARNHRIGQSRPVTYIDLVAKDTVDERIVDVLSLKQSVTRALLVDNWKRWFE